MAQPVQDVVAAELALGDRGVAVQLVGLHVELLGVVEDTHEFVLHRAEEPVPPAAAIDEMFVVWSAARAEANLAYDAWCDRRCGEAYWVYRAAEDRADAAEAALAQSHFLAAA